MNEKPQETVQTPGTAPRLPLCADVSRELGEDPIGTASYWQELTVLELDISVWPQVREKANWTAFQAEVMAALGDKVKAAGVGFGLLMSAAAPRSPLRVRHYTLTQAGYLRQDYASDLPQSEWAQGLQATLLEPERLNGRQGSWQAEPIALGLDYHVCTHGTVDASCGKYGMRVYNTFRESEVRAWRTGHFGGHRFAATAVELPTGLIWAHLTPELALKVARREVAPAEVKMHLRGYAGLPALAQVLDRELLMTHGWEWLTARRWATVEGEEVTLHYHWRSQEGQVSARVPVTQTLQVPGSSHKPGTSTVKQYGVQWLEPRSGVALGTP